MTRTDHNWIQTYTGRQFWPLTPRAEDVCIEDIAHALANECRFSGHTRVFYSVAQHCVIGSYFCQEPFAFLMHDSPEAYLKDLPRPVKHDPSMQPYRDAEECLQRLLCRVFGLQFPLPACVREIDDRMCQTERRDLMSDKPAWSITNVIPLPIRIDPWTPLHAERKFLRRFRELTDPFGWLRTLGLMPSFAFRSN